MWVEAKVLIYMCIAVWDPINKNEEGWYLIYLLNSAILFVCLNLWPGIPWEYVILFVFIDLNWDVIIRFVDIGEVAYFTLKTFFSQYYINNNANCINEDGKNG